MEILLAREDLQIKNLSPDIFYVDNDTKIDIILLLFRDPRFEISQIDAVCFILFVLHPYIYYLNLVETSCEIHPFYGYER